jgi:hypothetical protein
VTEIVPDYIRDADDLAEGGPITTLMKNCADVLERHYKGWLWAIEPEPKNGVMNIYSLRCSGKWAYTLHLSRIQNDPSLRDVVRAGGELLERFGFRRVPYSYAEWRRREQVLGQFIPDVPDRSAMERRKAKNLRAAQHNRKVMADVAAGRARILTDTSIAEALRSAYAAS